MSESQQGWLYYLSRLPFLSFFFSRVDNGSIGGTANDAAHSDSSSIVQSTDILSANLFFGGKVIVANRPRDSRRPWLPRFPKLKRHYPRVEQNLTESSLQSDTNRPPAHRKPRFFLRQKFLADTVYPRLDPSDHQQEDICFALASLHRQRVPREPRPAPQELRLPKNSDTVFVEINGIRSNKRRAQYSEVDLVAATQISTQSDSPSSIAIIREGILPESEFEYQEKVEAYMSHTKPLPEIISGMMTNIFSSFSDLTGRFSRILYNQAYEVSESRFYIEIQDPRSIDVAKKRVKLTSHVFDFEWLDRDGLRLLLSRYSHFRHCFDEAGSILYTQPSRAEMNELLKPLLPAMTNSANDLRALSLGHDGTDLLSFWFYLCRSMITFLNSVYEIGRFIKIRDKYPRVPTVWPDTPTPENLETASRIQKFLSDPSLFVVLKTILKLNHKLENYPMPTDMIDRVVLDMAAFQHNIVLPSYVHSDHFHGRLLECFPPPQRLDPGYVYPILPGAFPNMNDESQDLDVVTKPEDSPLPPRVESPRPPIAKKGLTKTDRLRAEFLEANISRLTPEEFQTIYCGPSDQHREIEKTYITDFVAKEPLATAQIGAVKSILKNRKAPRRLTMTRAPKIVRFTEDTITPRQRTHLGLDVRRLLPDSDRANDPSFISGVKLRQPGPSTDNLDIHELEYLRAQHTNRHVNSIFHGAKRSKPQLPANDDGIDPSLAIERMLSAPSAELFAISDDAIAGIAIKKKQAAQKAAEDARKHAEERARRELEEKLAETGGLRVPKQPLVSPLSDHWLERTQGTLHKSPKTTLAKTADGINLRRHDFATVVKATEWLNDEIVNGCLNWLDQCINSASGIKDIKKNTRKCLAMSSFFFKYLRENGFNKSEKTLRRHGVEKKNFLQVDTILLPVCERSHWTLLVIRPSKRTVAHMDSLNPGGSSPTYINLVLKWLQYILEETFVEDEWKVAQHEAPRQTNGYDCGVHTVTNGMCIALGLNPIDSYATRDMPQQRLRLAGMLLNGGFKGDFDLRVY
ncbi:sentrin/SUMO-specific protease [Metarhizium album ARSEF 1941]|uniref:Sentrin/SUMO-specific protease n=1 Tax=Metarhizium album (strain ARSEF 1941) TaxID=1081103 RepID=A0A0B2WWN7_METAS|nr:sentrin/SUMO-specific protease [Metarhizium album ARSEF 1941]KHN97832.1 sentrin/SUMO-specific protease [Metarhizium album ARSEF 1941]